MSSRKHGTSQSSSSSTSTNLRTFTKEEINKIMGSATRIGKGKCAIVYKGKWQNKDVAIKKYSADERPRWEIEKKFFENFKHRHIIGCYGYCDRKDAECFIMEYMPLCLINKNDVIKLDWPTTLKVIIQTTEAVQYINSKEKIIVDLKSDAIMLDEQYNVKLVDFNSVKNDKEIIDLHTNAYSAPEATRGKSGHLRSDVYSIGTIILEMLSRTKTEERRKHVQDQDEGKAKAKYQPKKRDEKKDKRTDPHITILAADKKLFKIHDDLVNTGCSGDVSREIVQIAIESTTVDPGRRLTVEKLLERLQKLRDEK